MYGLLLLLTCVYFVIIFSKIYNAYSYAIIVCLLSIIVIEFYKPNLINSNTLFYFFFLYTLGLGPIFLMMAKIQYSL